MQDGEEEILDGQEDASLQEGQELDESLEGEIPGADEGEDETEGAEEGDEGLVEEPKARKGRAGETIRQLRARVQKETSERQRIDRELQELRAEQRMQQQRSQKESPETKAARRALMDPLDVMREDLLESEARTRDLLQQQAIQTQETQDRLAYNSILRDTPQLRKYDAEVEKERLEQKARGIFVPREVLLDLVIGRAARTASSKATPKAKQEGQRKIAQQQSRSAQSRGDTATQRGRQGDSVEKRLENLLI